MLHDFFKTGHGLRLVETRLRLGEDLMEWCARLPAHRAYSSERLGPNDVNFPSFPFLEGPILLQPIFQKNL